MSTLTPVRSRIVLFAAGMVALAISSNACLKRTEVELPLLVIAGPDNFTSFEMRAPSGETIWRLEAETPREIPFLVYASVPEGFRQILPATGPPRPLRLGEDLVLESRIPTRAFIHRAFASTSSTITVLGSEMRRIEPDNGGAPSGRR